MSSLPSDQKAELLKACGVGIRHRQHWLLYDFNLTLSQGQIITLVGSNGSGKTTLAKIMLGIRAPTTGTVWRRDGLRIGYLPQQIYISPTLPLTVARMLTLTAHYRRAEILTVLASVEGVALVDQPWEYLSGGERQRVLLARALLGQPDLLVLDEPLQGVDTASLIPLYHLINQLREQINCGILLISHDLHLIRSDLITQATDQVICLNSTCSTNHTPLAAS